MARARAKKGGEVGKNGEFYEGGKFLPSTEQPKRRGSRPAPVRRQEIEPGVFADAPEGQTAIWQAVKALVDHGARMADPSAPLRPIQNPSAIEYYGGQVVIDRIDAYNLGERWMQSAA